MPLVRLDPSLVAESSISTSGDPVLQEIEEYTLDPQDNEDSINRLVEGEEEVEENEASTSGVAWKPIFFMMKGMQISLLNDEGFKPHLGYKVSVPPNLSASN